MAEQLSRACPCLLQQAGFLWTSNTLKTFWLLCPHPLAAAAVTSGARKWSLVFVGIGVGAIVAALFQASGGSHGGGAARVTLITSAKQCMHE